MSESEQRDAMPAVGVGGASGAPVALSLDRYGLGAPTAAFRPRVVQAIAVLALGGVTLIGGGVGAILYGASESDSLLVRGLILAFGCGFGAALLRQGYRRVRDRCLLFTDGIFIRRHGDEQRVRWEQVSHVDHVLEGKEEKLLLHLHDDNRITIGTIAEYADFRALVDALWRHRDVRLSGLTDHGQLSKPRW